MNTTDICVYIYIYIYICRTSFSRSTALSLVADKWSQTGSRMYSRFPYVQHSENT